MAKMKVTPRPGGPVFDPANPKHVETLISGAFLYFRTVKKNTFLVKENTTISSIRVPSGSMPTARQVADVFDFDKTTDVRSVFLTAGDSLQLITYLYRGSRVPAQPHDVFAVFKKTSGSALASDDDYFIVLQVVNAGLYTNSVSGWLEYEAEVDMPAHWRAIKRDGYDVAEKKHDDDTEQAKKNERLARYGSKYGAFS